MPAASRWNVPNLLTVSRMLVAPFAVYQILAGHPRPAFVLLFLAGVTDLLDGIVARRTGGESALGQLLDPVADKILLCGVFLGLAWIKTVPVWFVTIVFGRDVFLLGASAATMVWAPNSNLKPTRAGKISTLFQIATAAFWVAANALENNGWRLAGRALLWPTAVLTVVSGVHYGWRGLYHLRRR